MCDSSILRMLPSLICLVSLFAPTLRAAIKLISTMTAREAKMTQLTTIANSVAKKVFQNEFIKYYIDMSVSTC